HVLGFITAFLRPDAPSTLMVWQVGVDDAARGQGLASRMLDYLVTTTGAQTLETTVTDDNTASNRLFAALAQRHAAQHDITPLSTPRMYPACYDSEYLHRIGQRAPAADRQTSAPCSKNVVAQ